MLCESELYGASHTLNEIDLKEIEAPSWICCLFTVLALGCPTTDEDGQCTLKSSEFFSEAKSMASLVVEDGSIQSIQALLLMVETFRG